MPEVNIADGDVVTGADFDSIDDQLLITCTSASRPTGVEGRRIAETDSNKQMVYDGSAWNLDGGFGWVTFTPSWTNLTIGNGTQTGAYRYADGGMWVRVVLTFGSTTSISGSVSLAVPNSETSVATTSTPIGQARFEDTGTGTVVGVVSVASASIGLTASNASSTYTVLSSLSSTVPFTWTTSDAITFSVFVPL